ncbi:MAG: endonuclease/exonuclease/phosphatase family protein [Balneolaceae bacterium]
MLLILGMLPVLFGFLGKLHWFLDVFSHFRVYYIIYFVFVSLLAVASKKWKEVAVSVFIASVLVIPLMKFYLPAAIETNSKTGLKVAALNLLSSNQEYNRVIDYLDEEKFDIIFFLELNSEWDKSLMRIDEEYPYKLMIPRSDNFGIGLISKVPLVDVQNIGFSNTGIPSILVSLLHDDKELKIIGTHPLPPVGEQYFSSRNAQFEALNDFIKNQESEVLLIGDLNSTVFSPNFKILTKDIGLIDSRLGYGLFTSWNAQWSLISVAIDHAFVTNGIEVINRGVGKEIGSDHLPITIEIGWKE